jgi:NADH-quinone oxidoreductase subunit J
MSGHTSPLSFLPIGATLAQAPTTSPASVDHPGTPLAPVVLMILCAAAGVATVMLLPSRREAPLRKVGAVVLLAVGLIFAALLVRWTAGSASGSGMGAYFWIFSAVALVGALRVVTHTKPVYSALYFVLTVFATAGLFLLLWAEFMAAALVLIYAGAILVTYVFVIMLAAEAAHPGAGVQRVSETDAVSREPVLASAVGYLLMGVILFVIFDKASDLPRAGEPTPHGAAQLARQTEPAEDAGSAPAVAPASSLPRVQGATQQLGAYLFRNQLVNLELAGLILTVAMVGAIVIARKRVIVAPADDFGMPARPAAEVVRGPATPIDDDPHSIPVYGTLNPRQKEYPET